MNGTLAHSKPIPVNEGMELLGRRLQEGKKSHLEECRTEVYMMNGHIVLNRDSQNFFRYYLYFEWCPRPGVFEFLFDTGANLVGIYDHDLVQMGYPSGYSEGVIPVGVAGGVMGNKPFVGLTLSNCTSTGHALNHGRKRLERCAIYAGAANPAASRNRLRGLVTMGNMFTASKPAGSISFRSVKIRMTEYFADNTL